MELIETYVVVMSLLGGGIGVISGRGGGLMILEVHFWQWRCCQKGDSSEGNEKLVS
jgi:hypothetical protein